MHNLNFKIITLILLLCSINLNSQDKLQYHGIQLHDKFNKIIIEKLEMRDAPIGDVLRLIASQNGINIFVAPELDQRVSIFLQNATLDDILNYLSDQYNFTFRMSGDIIHVDPPPLAKPLFSIRFDKTRKKLSIETERASFAEILDSLSNITRDNFVYEGKLKDEKISIHLLDLNYPEDLLQYISSKGITVQVRGQLILLRDNQANEQASIKMNVRQKIEVNANGNLNLQVAEEPIAEIIRKTSFLLNKNIVVYDNPGGKISIHVEDVTFEEFLSLALNGTGFTFRKMNNVYAIGDQKIRGIQSNKVIRLQHIKVEGIKSKIPEYLLKEAEISELKEHNSISVVAYPSVIRDIEQYLNEIDKEIPQVLIEAIVVDFDISNQRELGLKGGLSDKQVKDSLGVYQMLPGVDILFKGKIQQQALDNVMGAFGNVLKITKLPDNFFLQLKALESIGKANVKSKPHIATLNGHEAELKIGVTQYYKLKTNSYYGGIYPQNQAGGQNQSGTPFYPSETERFEKVDATVSLKLTPWISGDKEVTVEIHPDFQTPVTELNPDVPPTIQYRSLNSTVRLKDGETIILGGLIQEIEREKTEQVPILGDIPLIGALFRSKSTIKQKKEMVIYVTPHIYKRAKTGIDAYTNIRFAN